MGIQSALHKHDKKKNSNHKDMINMQEQGNHKNVQHTMTIITTVISIMEQFQWLSVIFMPGAFFFTFIQSYHLVVR